MTVNERMAIATSSIQAVPFKGFIDKPPKLSNPIPLSTTKEMKG